MTGFRDLVAIVLVAGLINVGFPQQAQAMAATSRSEEVRQKVEQLGAGADVRVTLKDQQRAFRGTVESFDDSAFRLRTAGTGEPKAVRYAEVAMLEFTQSRYRAEGSPDPVTVRRVAVELGVGRKVHVQTQDRNAHIGRIARLDDVQLYINLGEGGPVNISYAEIRELKPKGMGVAAKVLIVVGIVGGLMAVGVSKGHD